MVNHKKVQRLMKGLGLSDRIRRKRKYYSYQGEVGKKAENLIQRQFEASKPMEKFYTDVTEFAIPASSQKLYLSPVLDGFNSEIIAYHLSTSPNLEQVKTMFLSGEVDEVVLVYTKFVNSLLQEVTHERLLPLSLESDTAEAGESLFYPDQGSVLEQLLPAYVESTVYNALLHGAASELGARMTAMTSATDNAGELIGTLHLEYNKLRQAGITNEISEIVGGANALQ